MKRAESIASMVLVLALFIGLLFFLQIVPDKIRAMYNPGKNSGTPVQNSCSIESRKVEVCTKNYQAVCGWFDSQKVQCFKYPCAQTYSNSCFACMDAKVSYWTDGECPK